MLKKLLLLIALLFSLLGYSFAQQTDPQPRVWVLGDFGKGLNSHISDLNTPDNQANEAQNVRFNSKFSTLSKREVLLTSWDAGSATINGLHRYYKSDGTLKTIIATSTYLDIGSADNSTTTHIASGLNDGKMWQFVTFKDVAIGTNGYDQAVKYDGHTLTTANTTGARTVGELCAELGSPFATLKTGNNLTAAKWYQYKMMFGDGTTEYYSNARSNPILTGDGVNDIDLSNIPQGPTGTTYRLIYRTLGDANQAAVEADTVFYQVTNITDNVNTTYTDRMNDTTAANETAWDTSGRYECTPKKGKYATIHKERLWVSGNTTYKSDVYFSDDGNPDFFDPDDFFVVREDDGDEVTFIKTLRGILTVGKTNSIQSFYTDGDTTTDWYASDVLSSIGCPAPYSVDVTPLGIFYLGRHGLYRYNGQVSTLISDAVTDKISDISQADIEDTAGIFHNNEYYLAYTSSATGLATNNRVLMYDLVRDAYVLDTVNIRCWASFNSGTDFGNLYSGSSNADGLVLAHSPTINLIVKRYKSELDLGTFDDIITTGTENEPILKLGWDCTISGWLTELETKNANITNISSIETYLPNATIAIPDFDGNWTSPIYQVNAETLDKLYWNENLGPFGDVNLRIRLNSTSTMTGVNWSSAYTNSNGDDVSGVTGNTYIQFAANLTTTNTTYTPYLFQTDGYVFRLLYSKIGAKNESSVLSLYKTGWKDFGIPLYRKMITRVKVFYKGTSGTINFNIKGDDGDIDKTFSIDLSVDPNYSILDEYTGEGDLKVYTFLPPINSPTEPSLTSQFFQFLITEGGTTGWDIKRVEVRCLREEMRD